MIHFCCFKPPSLWSIRAAPGDEYHLHVVESRGQSLMSFDISATYGSGSWTSPTSRFSRGLCPHTLSVSMPWSLSSQSPFFIDFPPLSGHCALELIRARSVPSPPAFLLHTFPQSNSPQATNSFSTFSPMISDNQHPVLPFEHKFMYNRLFGSFKSPSHLGGQRQYLSLSPYIRLGLTES